MKIKNLACIASMLLATLTAVQAQTNTLVGWTFDNYTAGTITNSPAATSNTGTASVVGLSTGTVVGLPGSSTGTTDGTNAWEVTGGWSTNSAIGSQGAQFAVGTLGYYQVQLSFDVYAQTNAEAYLQVQYSPDGLTWFNANITSPGSSGVLATNSITTT
jgi:streptogramin lyase